MNERVQSSVIRGTKLITMLVIADYKSVCENVEPHMVETHEAENERHHKT